MKKSKNYSVIASYKRAVSLKYAIFGLILSILCIVAVPFIVNSSSLDDSYLIIFMALIVAGISLWFSIKFFLQTFNHTLLAGDEKYLYFKKRLLTWKDIEQFLFTEEVINNKKVIFLTVAFKRIPVGASLTFSKDKQPAVGDPVVTKNPKKDTIYRVRLDDIEQSIENVEKTLYQYLKKYGKDKK